MGLWMVWISAILLSLSCIAIVSNHLAKIRSKRRESEKFHQGRTPPQDISTTLPQGHAINVQTGGSYYNPQMEGTEIKTGQINIGPSGSGYNMRFNSPNGQTSSKDNSTTLPQGDVTNYQTGGGVYNPQAQGNITAKKINMGPSGNADMRFNSPNERTPKEDNIKTRPEGRTTNNETPPKDKGKTQPQGHVTNHQTGGGDYNPQMQGEIEADEINMGPSDSARMTFGSPNVELKLLGIIKKSTHLRTGTATKGRNPPKDESKAQPQGHVTNHQTGGGDYNPQMQGEIRAGEINMGPSVSGNMNFGGLKLRPKKLINSSPSLNEKLH